jgi:hypothetical protein
MPVIFDTTVHKTSTRTVIRPSKEHWGTALTLLQLWNAYSSGYQPVVGEPFGSSQNVAGGSRKMSAMAYFLCSQFDTVSAIV